MRDDMKVWRQGRATQIFAGICTLFTFGCAVEVAFVEKNSPVNSTSDRMFGSAILLIISFILFWTSFHPRLEVDRAGIGIVGIFKSKFISWDEFEWVYSEREGLKIKSRERKRPYNAWAVQRPMRLPFLRYPLHADLVVAEIQQMHQKYGGCGRAEGCR